MKSCAKRRYAGRLHAAELYRGRGGSEGVFSHSARTAHGTSPEGRATFGMAKIGAEKNLAPVPKYHCNIWYNFADGGTPTSLDREWWLVVPTGLWLGAVISWWQDGCF